MKEIKRNPGIDFLRLLAMYLVVVYHLLFHGGILDAGQNSGAAQLLRVLTLCAVDGFALISGYVGLREEKPRFPVNRMARLWLQILFYSLLMLLAAACVYRPILSKSSLLRALLPVASDQYWYVTAYMPLCLMMPWLNALLYRLDRRELGLPGCSACTERWPIRYRRIFDCGAAAIFPGWSSSMWWVPPWAGIGGLKN